MPHRKQFDSDEAFQKALRDYFAAKAMQGFCSNSAHSVLDGEHEFEAAAKEAYFMADVMLKVREV